MANPAFIALGDLHLDFYIWRKFKQVKGDSFLGFTSLINRGIALGVPVVLVGDIFDTVEPDPAIIRFFRREMDRCRDNDVEVYAIQGNHDRRPIPWYSAVHDWPIHIGDGEEVDINGIGCVAFDNMTRDKIEDAIMSLRDCVPKPDVLFLHQAVRQMLSFEGAWNCDLDWIPEGIPATIMGDIHKEWEHKIREGQKAYYTGSSHPREAPEIGSKSCIVVNDDLSVERLPIDYRPMTKLYVRSDKELEDLRSWVNEAVESNPKLPPFAWVVASPEKESDILEFRESFEDGSVIIITEPFTFKDDIEDPIVDDEECLSIEALLSRFFDPDEEPKSYSFAADLLGQSKSVLDVIGERRDQFYQETEGS